MISDQMPQSSESNAQYSSLLLTVEESFFIELLQKREKSTINIKFTTKSAQFGNLEPFTNYYTEAEILRLLESLVSKKMIVKQEKGVVLLCPKCGGHANMPVLVCPRCGSTKVGRKEDLNHSECDYWGPREEFIDGVLLRCPRCDEQLDEKALEGTSGYFSVSDLYFECQDCGTAVSKSNITMVCIKCNNKYTTVQASYLNSVSYVLASVIPEKTHRPPPKTIQEKIEEESKYRLLEESKTISQSEPRSLGIEEKQESEPKKLEKIEQEEPKIDERSASLAELKKAELIVEPKEIPVESKIEEIKSELIDEPTEQSIKKPADEPVEEPAEAMITEPEPDVILEPVEIPEPAIEEKPKKEILQTPFRLVTDLFKKKPRKKSTRKQKPKPEPEPRNDDEDFDYENEPFFEEPQPVKTPVEPEAYQILMIVENVTVSEFIIESLEGVKKPINVIHIDDGSMALKELRHKYDALILDLDLKTVNSKFLLSEMEKWSIMTPIIAVSDNVERLDKYVLNVETVLKKKQGEINKIRKILQKLL